MNSTTHPVAFTHLSNRSAHLLIFWFMRYGMDNPDKIGKLSTHKP